MPNNPYRQLNDRIAQVVDRTLAPQPLFKSGLLPNPLDQFAHWLAAALDAEPAQSNAVCLATATPDAAPSARMVLLKSFGTDGFVFYTNHESQKGRELAANPQAAMLFYWPTLRRQVRLWGPVARVPEAEAWRYFQSRHPESQLGAWASPQSHPIANRAEIETALQQMRQRFAQTQPPLPPFWGGYRLSPQGYEFWQHHPFRLHDRFSYHRKGAGWTLSRLAP